MGDSGRFRIFDMARRRLSDWSKQNQRCQERTRLFQDSLLAVDKIQFSNGGENVFMHGPNFFCTANLKRALPGDVSMDIHPSKKRKTIAELIESPFEKQKSKK